MGATKYHLYSPKVNHIAHIAKALGHPARIEILLYLYAKKRGTSLEFYQHTGLSQSTISEHVRRLRMAKLIKGIVKRNTIIYQLRTQNSGELLDLLSQFDDMKPNKVSILSR